MLKVRMFEQKCDELYKERKIRGFCHLSIGQEAIYSALAATTHGDAVITSYRCHGTALMSGVPARELFAELMGKVTGCSKGKGGSMHIYGNNFYGGNGIVGAQVPLGTGIALANKYLEKNITTHILYGDGAANQGQVYEAFNMAKLWTLPCVFICENNIYGMGTSTKRSSADINYHNKCSYIPGIKVDAMDFLALKRVLQFSREFSLASGPIIIEAVTYRYSGHSMSDPGISYRERSEITNVRKTRDPIARIKSHIIDLGAASAPELDSIAKKVGAEIADAASQAEIDGFPVPDALFHHVYATSPSVPLRSVIPN